MRRSASEIIRNLERRIARLEKSASLTTTFLDLVEDVLPFRTTRGEDMIEFEGPNATVFTISYDRSDLNHVRIEGSYDFHSRGVARQNSISAIESSMKNLFGRDTMFSEEDGEFRSTIWVNSQRKDLKEAKEILNICKKAIKFLERSL